MQIETYFDFLAADDIRLKGSRIGIESILYEYLYHEQNAEAIAARYPTLSLEAIYILYYLQNRPQMEQYLADWLAFGQEVRETQRQNPPPVILRLQRLKSEHQTAVPA
ncbi:MAG: DUF433 domain-containing protein [Chloroflexi bacterium]|nr:DUF433 domain-containing protein [Ardenticatenaceae bacterium]MBL1127636.1 DUF433 domain-containing protein [Chloroflexota bacterium]NOG33701.1 DUF433 domain-containing protein [Chloroflexota bacterium]GIK56022.1 MAG: hypothetical protein BroJett015_16850 [Chloroflexota bacterium]